MNGIRSATGFVIAALPTIAACSSSDLRWRDTSELPGPAGGTESGNGSVNAGSDVGGQSAGAGGSGASSAGAAPLDALAAGGDSQGVGGSVAPAWAGAEHAGGDAGSGGGGTSGTEGCLPGCCGSQAGAEPLPSEPRVIAESAHGFSDTQGKCGWSYGYLPSGEEPFTPLSRFGASSSPAWQASAEVPPWSAIYREAQHPNQIPLQWIVRRWTSHVQGVISISGHVAKVDVEGGDGIIAQVRVGGRPRWEVSIAFDDSGGLDFRIAESVVVGTNVDFIVAPKDGDAHDSTSFVVSIAW